MIPTPKELLTVAKQAAQKAGGHVLAQLARRGDTDKILRHDIKHKLDRESQEVATATILSAFPHHAILGEETSDAPLPESEVRWIIDPIDGTINFTHGLPLWCCCVAAQIHEKTVAGVVFAPELGKLFEAQADAPALCNGQPLYVSETPRLELSLLHTGADKDFPGGPSFRFLNCISTISQRPRLMGSAALDICWVASGCADGYFEGGVYIWDIAAAALILECAGGTGEVLQHRGNHRMAFMATNGKIHQALRDALAPLL